MNYLSEKQMLLTEVKGELHALLNNAIERIMNGQLINDEKLWDALKRYEVIRVMEEEIECAFCRKKFDPQAEAHVVFEIGAATHHQDGIPARLDDARKFASCVKCYDKRKKK